MISLCAVLVSTPQARCWIIAVNSAHESLLRSASRPSSTAANATSVPATALPAFFPPAVTLMRATAFCRTAYCGLSVLTWTCSSCSARPMLSAATPSLKAGRDRSTIAVGAWYSRPS